LSGLSIGFIAKELKRRGVKPPQGKDIWSKKSVQTVLGNEKYIGQVLLGKTYTGDFPNNKQFMNDGEHEQFLMKDAHEPIMDSEKFEQVQEEMKRRRILKLLTEQ